MEKQIQELDIKGFSAYFFFMKIWLDIKTLIQFVAIGFILEIFCIIKNADDFVQVTGILVSIPQSVKLRKLNQIHHSEREYILIW